MKKLMVILMLVLAGLCFARDRYTPLSVPEISSAVAKASNSMVISDADAPESSYDKLITAGGMGTLSSTNRRTLFLLPGTYTLTANWALDTDYVDVISVSGNPDDVIITKGTGSATVTQTAADVRLSGFTIQNTGSASGDHGFLIAATTNNDASIYRYMKFSQTHTTAYTCYPVFATSDLGGTWEHCGDSTMNYAWRCANTKNMTATMKDCVAGILSYGGDAEDVSSSTNVISGSFYRCKGGFGSFGGCLSYGMSITGYLEDCISGSHSYAMGKTFSGKAVRCIGGTDCFAGWNPLTAVYGTFSGTAIDCITDGGNSFGMGHASCAFSGTLIRCVNGSGAYGAGALSSGTTTLTNNATKAAVTTSFAEANSNLTLTAKRVGKWGNNIRLVCTPQSSPTTVIAYEYGTEQIIINLKFKSNNKTANQLKTSLDGSALIASLVDVTVQGDGTGLHTFTVAETYNLTGGVDAMLIQGCNSVYPAANTASDSIYYFANGQTYTNAGATGAITLTLPAAVPGFEFAFADVVDTATVDLYIDCVGTDNFVKPNGTAMADAEQYQSNNDTFGKVTAHCYMTGIWQLENEVGTWAEESP